MLDLSKGFYIYVFLGHDVSLDTLKNVGWWLRPNLKKPLEMKQTFSTTDN